MSSTLDITFRYVGALSGDSCGEPRGQTPRKGIRQCSPLDLSADIKNGSNTTPVFYPTAQKGFPASGVSTRSEMFLPSLRHHDH